MRECSQASARNERQTTRKPTTQEGPFGEPPRRVWLRRRWKRRGSSPTPAIWTQRRSGSSMRKAGNGPFPELGRQLWAGSNESVQQSFGHILLVGRHKGWGKQKDIDRLVENESEAFCQRVSPIDHRMACFCCCRIPGVPIRSPFPHSLIHLFTDSPFSGGLIERLAELVPCH